MPQRDRVMRLAMACAVVVLVAGCGRLNLTKPSYKRGSYEQTAPQVHIDPKSHTRDVAFTMVQVAQARLIDGDARGALDAAQRAVRAATDSPEANSVLGLALDASGRPAEAGPHHRRAAELAPERGELLNNYGIWLCTNAQATASLEWFDRAVRAPGYTTPDMALANAAACALRGGQRERAERDARQALIAAPANPLALVTLARLEHAAGRNLQARAFVERRLAAAPADAETLQLASQIEQSLGDSAASSRYVDRLRTEFPPDSRPSGDDK